MANKNSKFSENVAGKYYVDSDCTGCNLCIDYAPLNFKMSDDDSHAYVSKQSENEEEEKACLEAMENCPVEAIGNDG